MLHPRTYEYVQKYTYIMAQMLGVTDQQRSPHILPTSGCFDKRPYTVGRQMGQAAAAHVTSRKVRML
jgi:hypothetical protein